MKTFKYLTIAIVAICLASCGGKQNSEETVETEDTVEIVLTPETTQIKGDLGDYFEVVEKEYTATNEYGLSTISIEVKRTDTDYSFDLKGVDPYGTYGQGVTGHAGFGIEILDEKGNVIEKEAATAGNCPYADMKEALKLKAGETATVRWSFSFDSDKKPAKFRLTSAYEEVDSSNWGSSSSSSSDDKSSSSDDDDDTDSYSSSSSGSQAWDALLHSYEQYVDKYISYMKKAAKGDMSALAEYPALMKKAQEFSEKMENAQGDMSASQWARYMKITKKMTKAAQE